MKGSLYDGAYGVRIFKPWRVQYCISAKEFCELAAAYIKDRFCASIEFELVDEHDGTGELNFKNVRCLTSNAIDEDHDETLERLEAWGLDETAPYNNFDLMTKVLFDCGTNPEVTAEWVSRGEDSGPCVFAYVEFKDYIKAGGSNAERSSEED